MTQLLDQAFERVRTWPESKQDHLAQLLMQFASDDQTTIQLSPEEEADLIEAEAEIERGEIMTDEQVKALWAKYDL